ncbi:hypothetical protein [Flexilinea flocculi]|uniref:Glycosyltransferase RgtA/B/C/D-like domain-containing protein n=1 Tax=Flexilinea flocculi TaxID=1678840 RepID=A0A0K8PAB6_9CHLR|nr:hypothetical protein [Flexilinea flocculi]GAP39090.1 hypothetical protein ATC1_119 [Flexilinea flocculi]
MKILIKNHLGHLLFRKTSGQQNLIILFIFILSTLLARALYQLVDAYSVNIIFWDQFDFMTPFFLKQNAWTMFTWQHGPHRQGLGELLTWVVIRLSGWNTRAESFMIFGVLLLSLPPVLLLKRKLIGRFQWIDLIIPFIVLNKYQWEQFVVTPNVSHSVLPLLLIFVYVLSWMIPNKPWRYTIVLLINFLLLFTGFGLFMGFITAAVFGLELITGIRSHQKRLVIFSVIGFSGAVSSLYLFSCGYKFSPAVACFGFQWDYILRYPVYVGLMLAKFLGINNSINPYPSIIAGLLILAAFIAAFGWNLRAYLLDPLSPDQTHKIISILLGFSLVFAAFTSVGRICLGLEQAQSSRYMTLLIPGFVGLLMTISQIRIPKITIALSVLLAFSLVKTILPFDNNEQDSIVNFYEGKTKWKECYLLTGDYPDCNERTGFSIYPAGSERILDRLIFFESNHQNLFLDNP